MTTVNLQGRVGQGIAPQTFIDGMTRNQEKFQEWQQAFQWTNADDESFFTKFNNPSNLRCLIIAADWCGDVVRNIPVILQLTEAANIPTEIFIMEEHLDFIDAFLTMGGRSIPVVLFVNEQGDLVGRWGPRPRRVQEVMEAFKALNPDREASNYEASLKAARQEMMSRYGEDAGYQAEIVREVRELLSH